MQPAEALRRLEGIVRASRDRPKRTGSAKALSQVETISLPPRQAGNIAAGSGEPQGPRGS
jgi:hypothetical protein